MKKLISNSVYVPPLNESYANLKWKQWYWFLDYALAAVDSASVELAVEGTSEEPAVEDTSVVLADDASLMPWLGAVDTSLLLAIVLTSFTVFPTIDLVTELLVTESVLKGFDILTFDLSLATVDGTEEVSIFFVLLLTV